jgi:hypothetical protein
MVDGWGDRRITFHSEMNAAQRWTVQGSSGTAGCPFQLVVIRNYTRLSTIARRASTERLCATSPTDRNADVTDPTRSGDRHKGSSFRSIGKYWEGPSSSSNSCCAATAKKSSEVFDHFHMLHPLRFPAAAIDFSPTRRWTRTGWAGR